jgi:hypothetical protein
MTVSMPKHLRDHIVEESRHMTAENPDCVPIKPSELVRMAVVQFIQIRRGHIRDPRIR